MVFDSFALTDQQRATAINAFKRAASMFSSQTQFADVIGTSQQNVSKLIRHRRLCPPQHVLKIEAATGVSRHDLRPDIYPRDELAVASIAASVGGSAAVPAHSGGEGAGGTATPSRATQGPSANPAPVPVPSDNPCDYVADPLAGFAA